MYIKLHADDNKMWMHVLEYLNKTSPTKVKRTLCSLVSGFCCWSQSEFIVFQNMLYIIHVQLTFSLHIRCNTRVFFLFRMYFSFSYLFFYFVCIFLFRIYFSISYVFFYMYFVCIFVLFLMYFCRVRA